MAQRRIHGERDERRSGTQPRARGASSGESAASTDRSTGNPRGSTSAAGIRGTGPAGAASGNVAAERRGRGSANTGARNVRLSQFSVDTAHGVAEVELDLPKAARGLLVLGHGASGGVDAADLVAVRDAAVAEGIAVARVTQPYRVQGRRAPAPATQLDAAWVSAVNETRRRVGTGLPVALGGRSAGARVAARTATELGAVGVLALAFPLHPPGKPESSRAGELDPARPTLVINGDKDPFGVPTAAGQVRVVVRPGERHDLRRDPAGVAEVAVAWLGELLGRST